MLHTQHVSFIWSIADLLRDTFKRSKYQDVILPFTVLRRISSVLQPTQQRVRDALATADTLPPDTRDQYLCTITGYAFYNTSPNDFALLLHDPTNLAANLRSYISGLSSGMRDVLALFDFDATITRLENAGLLHLVMERFLALDVHPERVSNLEMGMIFEELIRTCNEALNDNPGEHFTPREVIMLMVQLVLAPDRNRLMQDSIIPRLGKEGDSRTDATGAQTGQRRDRLYTCSPVCGITIADPCCGSGGMLTVAREYIHTTCPGVQVALYGQEVNPETYALCKADLYLTSPDGQDAEHIAFGSTLATDQHAQMRFDYMLANPPYGKDWKRDQAAVEAEARRGFAGRFGAGVPRISDGQLLFIQHMLARMKPPDEGGTRIAVVTNGSPLFVGDAGSGESEIRRWIVEHDWLEAIIALPEQLFYNTGIATYIWLLTNRKPPTRRGIVQLVQASDLWQALPRHSNLGAKRRTMTAEHRQQIGDILATCEAGPQSRLVATTDFGYRKITIDQPLRLSFHASEAGIARLHDQRAFQRLATSSTRKKSGTPQTQPVAGDPMQHRIVQLLRALPDERFLDQQSFEQVLDDAAQAAGLRLSAPIRAAILAALAERDAAAAICRDERGTPIPDLERRDTEQVPLNDDVASFFAREVQPHLPDAWINTDIRDAHDKKVGKVGYQIDINRWFWSYAPPRPMAEIEADIRALSNELFDLLRDVGGECR